MCADDDLVEPVSKKSKCTEVTAARRDEARTVQQCCTTDSDENLTS